MSEQPGYDELAELYDATFPGGYGSPVERHAVAAFADELLAAGLAGPVVDVGCGTGHIGDDLASRGLDVVGVDPSAGMLAIARRHYPMLDWVLGDAMLERLPAAPLSGVLARYSLIHVQPRDVPAVLDRWVGRLAPGARVLVALQCSDDPAAPVLEFDHKVARAWRWHPDAMAAALTTAGLAERWRLVTRPDGVHRFPECHLLFELPS